MTKFMIFVATMVAATFGISVIVACQPQTRTENIDGCQYLVTTSFVSGGAVENKCHKGDCTNPIHGNVKITENIDTSEIMMGHLKQYQETMANMHLMMDTICSLPDSAFKNK